MLRDLHQLFKVNFNFIYCHFIQQESLHQSEVQSLVIILTVFIRFHYITSAVSFTSSENDYLLSSESTDIH